MESSDKCAILLAFETNFLRTERIFKITESLL